MTSDELQQSEPVLLDGITAAQFRSLVDSLAEWISTGIVKIRIAPRPVIDFDDNKVLPLLKEKNLPQDCAGLMRWDISFMLSGILTGSRGAVISFLTENANVRQTRNAKSTHTSQIKRATTDRLNYVEQIIITSDLRSQYAIKDKAKTNRYYGNAWEVVRTQSQNDPAVPVGLIYASVRIDTLRPSPTTEEILPWSTQRATPFESIVLTMTFQDLTELAESLSNAAKATKQSIDSEGKH